MEHLWTWGYNQSGELGQNSNNTSHRSSPVQIPGTTWSSIAASSDERCHAIKTDGTLWSWGSG
jgi:alpha-tubulin suppressor-like RCC1 family protein